MKYNKNETKIDGVELAECIKLMRELVSNVQGAPYPTDAISADLYYIWYEHAQQSAVECFQFLNEHFPDEENQVTKAVNDLIE